MHFPISRHLHGHTGFSLIEIILALGIISFALVGILGLFPVAVDAAANSQRETQAALIARAIFEQLEATSETPARSVSLAERYDRQDPSPIEIDLSQTNPITPIGFDPEGMPLASASDPKAVYIVDISIFPIITPSYGLSKVVVAVRPASSKISYPFTSVLRQ